MRELAGFSLSDKVWVRVKKIMTMIIIFGNVCGFHDFYPSKRYKLAERNAFREDNIPVIMLYLICCLVMNVSTHPQPESK